jgi:putative transposase
MDENERLSYTKWDCKYHVVFIPKCRRKVLYGQLRRNLGEVFRRLAAQRECRIEEGHLMSDHVHMMIGIPPKYSVSQVVGYIKGKSAIHVARVYGRAEARLEDRAGLIVAICSSARVVYARGEWYAQRFSRQVRSSDVRPDRITSRREGKVSTARGR